jgi:hypothetical protein
MTADSSSRPLGSPPRPRWRLLALLAVTPLTACKIPTDVPILDSKWVVPTEETRFGVAELLPGDVTLTPDSSAFLVDFNPVTFSESLGMLCPACALADGTTVPKPPFLGSFSSAVDFPPEVSSVTVLDGEVIFDIHNGLNFDPLRPASGAFGSLTVEITDDADGDVLGTLTVDGSTTAMPVGATLTDTLSLSGATINGSLKATTTLNSPLGDPVTIDAGLEVNVTATPINIRVADVTVDVANRSVDLDPVSLDVGGIDTSVTDHIQTGSFLLDVTNPFGISATFQLTISGPSIPTIQKSADIGTAPTSTVEIDFTADELRSFLGQDNVTLTGSGVVDPGASAVTVMPGQELVLDANLGLTIRIGA